MPENRRRGGKRVRKRRDLLTGLTLFLAVVLLIFLDGLANWERVTDPTDEKGVEEKDLYRPQDWSEEIVMETETAVWYRDRTRERFLSVNREWMENMRRAWVNFSKLVPEEIPRHVVPIPPPVVYEQGFEADLSAYRDLVRGLTEELNGEVVDLYPALAEWSGEYIYYPEQSSLTNRGAYYAAAQLLNVLEGASLPPLEDYDEELYYSEGNELTYLYSLPGSRGYCEQFTVQDDGGITSVKKAVFRKHEVGNGSIIASSVRHWAVVEGDGAEEAGTLLLIGDGSGKAMVPFLANHYRRVYYVPVAADHYFGTEVQPLGEIFEKYDVTRVVYVQWASRIGDQSRSAAISVFMGQEGETTDGEAAG